ncbi:MAG TPA: hypothetical protein VFF73_40510 [Planctomycetota bacterium]|nr:hypothetical protein [Planctomycetota bacterium]
MTLELAPSSPLPPRSLDEAEQLWLREVGRPTPLRHSIFGGCFNIEYWSAELFGPPSGEDPEKKVFQVLHEEGRVGMIEVSSHNGQRLEPFDRLILLALMGLWYDQGCDPQGRIAFSYRELFRRLDLKVGGRQHEMVKRALERLRGCLVTQRDSFVVRTKDGGVVPVEREEDAFHLLQAKRTITLKGGKSPQTFVVCQLGEAVLSGLAGEFLQPRISAEHLKRLKAKMPHAILLHGYFNGRLKQGESRRFPYEELARVLRMRARHRSTLIARLLGPLKKLEDAGAIKIAEPAAQRRKQEFVTVSLALEDERKDDKKRPSEPSAFVPDKRDELGFRLFDRQRLKTQPQLAAAFFTLGVKIERVLEKLGVVSEKTLWSLLEQMRVRTWHDAEEAEAFVLEQLELGYEAPKDYVPPAERFKKRS